MNRAKILRFHEGEDPSSEDGRSDEDVMLAATADVSELGVLFDRHHRALFHFFFRVTRNEGASEDLVQDVFFRILKYRHSYRKGIPFARWMYRIAINARRDGARRRRSEETLAEVVYEIPGPGPLPEEVLSKRQELERLQRALLRLSEDKRELLVLSRFRSLKCGEIGEILGVSEGTVKVRIYRALKELKSAFLGNSGSGDEP